MKPLDPAAMDEAERFGEIATILAAGFQRFVFAQRKAESARRNGQNRLAALGAAEAACGSDVLNPKSTPEPAA